MKCADYGNNICTFFLLLIWGRQKVKANFLSNISGSFLGEIALKGNVQTLEIITIYFSCFFFFFEEEEEELGGRGLPPLLNKQAQLDYEGV